MYFFRREKAFRKAILLIIMLAVGGNSLDLAAQTNVAAVRSENKQINNQSPIVSGDESNTANSSDKPLVTSVLPKFQDAQTGLSAIDLVSRAFTSNLELSAARLDVDKARARLAQARLRPNPTLEVEQTTGRFTGSGGEGELSVGATLPLEVFGQRQSRLRVAEIEISSSEAEIANRERQLAGEVLANYVEALASAREIETLEKLLDLDLSTTRFVQIRVNEGETAPLELNLLQVEVDRMRAKRELAQGKLEASLTKLKLLAGMSFDEPLRVREQIDSVNLPTLPTSLETAVEVAVRTRPDIKLARIEEDLANAGLRLIRAQSKPEVSVTTRYTQSRSSFDNTPVGDLTSRDRTLTFGVSIALPIFNRNQGAKAEAEIAIRQAQTKREFAEQTVKSETAAAFRRIEAASRSLTTLQSAVLPRSEENIRVQRQVYELGEIKITDLIAEQRRLLEANQDLTETLTELFRARAELIVALGLALQPEK